MNFQEAKDAIRRAKPLLKAIEDLVQAVEFSNEVEKANKVALDKKIEAEKAYQLAHSERAQIIEAIENLKVTHGDTMVELANVLAETKADYAKRVEEAEMECVVAVAGWQEKAEEARQTYLMKVEKASVIVDALEARIPKAEAALAALKGA